MTGPRASIPDVILPAPDGSQWLARSVQLIVGASRGQPVRITLDAELLPVRAVVDGVAQVLPAGGVREGVSYDLADVPPALALALAQWMAGEAQPNGEMLLARLYPQPLAPTE
jgi:hypothetical protein